MADKSPESSPKIQRLESSKHSAKTKTLVVSIASFAVLITFALWTLLRTDFSTYSTNGDVNIADVTKAPEALAADEMIIDESDDDLVAVADEASKAASLAVQQELELLLLSQQHELDALKHDFATLERRLSQRENEILSLQQDLEIALQTPVVTVAHEPANVELGSPTVGELANQNDQLRQENKHLEAQLIDLVQHLRESQNLTAASEARSQELVKYQEELAKKLDIANRDKAQLETRVNQQQAKLTVQERSFQELSNAVKSHKQALKQMDQARMELATELDSTKSQYSKLLHAMAIQHPELVYTHETATVALADETPHAAPSMQEGQDIRYHVVSKGDTLTSISRHFYGTSQRWHEVYDANKAVLHDQNRLKVGLVLVIP